MSFLFKKLIRPALFQLDAERAHELGMKVCKAVGESVAGIKPSLPIGAIERFGLKFSNPLGLAPGFDKNGIVVINWPLSASDVVEVVTVT